VFQGGIFSDTLLKHGHKTVLPTTPLNLTCGRCLNTNSESTNSFQASAGLDGLPASDDALKSLFGDESERLEDLEHIPNLSEGVSEMTGVSEVAKGLDTGHNVFYHMVDLSAQYLKIVHDVLPFDSWCVTIGGYICSWYA